ncbi:MAG: hypothetical protein QE271_10320 [Bacteriovoracaceae bacterium]|nr:hypothetical protein [Bacteriovoracaceae bacterium]
MRYEMSKSISRLFSFHHSKIEAKIPLMIRHLMSIFLLIYGIKSFAQTDEYMDKHRGVGGGTETIEAINARKFPEIIKRTDNYICDISCLYSIDPSSLVWNLSMQGLGYDFFDNSQDDETLHGRLNFKDDTEREDTMKLFYKTYQEDRKYLENHMQPVKRNTSTNKFLFTSLGSGQIQPYLVMRFLAENKFHQKSKNDKTVNELPDLLDPYGRPDPSKIAMQLVINSKFIIEVMAAEISEFVTIYKQYNLDIYSNYNALWKLHTLGFPEYFAYQRYTKQDKKPLPAEFKLEKKYYEVTTCLNKF